MIPGNGTEGKAKTMLKNNLRVNNLYYQTNTIGTRLGKSNSSSNLQSTISQAHAMAIANPAMDPYNQNQLHHHKHRKTSSKQSSHNKQHGFAKNFQAALDCSIASKPS